jgi:lysophospholipase L1-like esterase
LLKKNNSAENTLKNNSISKLNIPYIKLIYPNGGEEFTEGTTEKIIWESANIEKINIELSIDNGSNWVTIVDGINADDTTYSWLIPDYESSNSLIRISKSDDNLIYDVSDSVFSTILSKPFVRLTSPIGGEYWTTGSFPIFSWESKKVVLVKIDLSTDNGLTWNTIIPYAIAANKVYSTWKIPEINSKECFVKISKLDDSSIFDVSKNPFTITTDSLMAKVVVIGSSTAYGVGASILDSAWAYRYKRYLTQKNTNVQLINLAVGGYTTYDLMPTDFEPPVGRPLPKPGANITRALTYNPLAILINLPSNDATQGYTINEQISNYDTIAAKAYEKNIPVWVSTTQPRNLTNDKRIIQMEMRDSTYSIFGDYAIDFWTDLANEDGTVNSYFDSGDGIHLNDAGHKILFERVLAEEIYEKTILPVSVDKILAIAPSNYLLEQNYPNPFNPTTNIRFNLPKESNVTLKIYNILGQEISTIVNKTLPAGTHLVTWNAANVSAGPYFYVLKANEYFESKKMLLLK